MRHQGTITEWRDEQGFGFVTAHGGTQRVFAHIKAFADRSRRPTVGQIVSFEQVTDSTGRLRAASIQFPARQASQRRQVQSRERQPSAFKTWLAFLFFVFLGIAVAKLPLPFYILAAYAGLSILTFFMYAFDKSAAQGRRWRTKEDTLHLLALLGGWPGALMAQNWLRHKSKKASFQAVFWITVILNCSALYFILKNGDSIILNLLHIQ